MSIWYWLTIATDDTDILDSIESDNSLDILGTGGGNKMFMADIDIRFNYKHKMVSFINKMKNHSVDISVRKFRDVDVNGKIKWVELFI